MALFGFGGRIGLGGFGGVGYGFGCSRGRGGGYGGAQTSGSLGTLSGVIPSCVGQLLPSEVVVQLSPFVVTIPGAMLSASCDPVAVGGYTPCAPYGYGLGGCDPVAVGGYTPCAPYGYGLGGYGPGRYGLGEYGLGPYGLPTHLNTQAMAHPAPDSGIPSPASGPAAGFGPPPSSGGNSDPARATLQEQVEAA
ncbi:chorion class B protein L11-like [Tiliqua scincoides]|uniref:chorion class B protein L11-like n=1 Tax=Tiliqua scincoides TaxID=71010 RepID=UPI0034633453